MSNKCVLIENRLIVERNNIQLSLKATLVLNMFLGFLNSENEKPLMEMGSMQLPNAVNKYIISRKITGRLKYKSFVHSLSIMKGWTISWILILIKELVPITKIKQDVQIERVSRFQVRAIKRINSAMKFSFSEAVKLSLRAMSRIFNVNFFREFIIHASLKYRWHLQRFERFLCPVNIWLWLVKMGWPCLHLLKW